jgi:hypothetical protein
MLPKDQEKCKYYFLTDTSTDILSQKLHKLEALGWEFVQMTSFYPQIIVLLRRKDGHNQEIPADFNKSSEKEPEEEQVPKMEQGEGTEDQKEAAIEEALKPTEDERKQVEESS